LSNKIKRLITNLYHKFIDNGIKQGDSFSKIKLARLTNVFGIICILYTCLMGIISIYNKEYYLILIDFFTASLLVANFYLLSKTNNIDLSADIILILLFITFSLLMIHGGINGTGPLWSLIFPAIAMQLKGCKRGSVYALAFILMIFTVLFVLSNIGLAHDYKNDFAEPESAGFRLLLIYFALYISSYAFTKNKQELIQENERLSLTDTLTNLPNRRKINEVIEAFVEKFIRNSFNNTQMITKLIDSSKQYSFGLILCDIDNFKIINDTYGHPIGDIALKQISAFLVKSLRTIDFVGRWGGEEFLIILDETDLKGAAEVGEKLRVAVAQHIFELKNIKVNMTLSFGISCFDVMQDITMFISKIDSYLNRAKRIGKNCVVYE